MFGVSNRYGAHNHADVNCVITVHHQLWKPLFPWKLVSSVLKNCCWNEFQCFCESNHLWAIIMLTPLAWWLHQNKEICIYLNGDYFCLFYKLPLTWISKFLRNQPCHQNKKIYVCLNAQCFCLFHKLLLRWISRFLWKQPSLTSMSQLSYWCFSRYDVIKTR